MHSLSQAALMIYQMAHTLMLHRQCSFRGEQMSGNYQQIGVYKRNEPVINCTLSFRLMTM